MVPEGERGAGAAGRDAYRTGQLQRLVADIVPIGCEDCSRTGVSTVGRNPAAAPWYAGGDHAAEYSQPTLKPFVDRRSYCANGTGRRICRRGSWYYRGIRWRISSRMGRHNGRIRGRIRGSAGWHYSCIGGRISSRASRRHRCISRSVSGSAGWHNGRIRGRVGRRIGHTGTNQRHIVDVHVGPVAEVVPVYQELDAYRLPCIRGHVKRYVGPRLGVVAYVHDSGQYSATGVGHVCILPVEGDGVSSRRIVPVGEGASASRYRYRLVDGAVARCLTACRATQEGRERAGVRLGTGHQRGGVALKDVPWSEATCLEPTICDCP